MRTALTLLVIGHGAVHAIMWTLPFTPAVEDMPFDPAGSWLLGDGRMVALVLAGLTTAAFVVAAFAFAASAGWWPIAMLFAVACSMVLLALFFTPLWVIGILINIVLAVYAWMRLA
jgi:nicotinamide riboside transporter PnuC